MKLKKIYYFNGTHWDREWYKSFQGFRYMLMGVLDEVIDTLERDPEFEMYTLDGQTAVLDDYCQIAPENRERLCRLIRAGRIAVGPWYTMPDEFLVSGESLIRNLLLGHERARAYGAPNAMKYGYVCDIFGHIAQLPQLLEGFRIHGALFQRGCNQDTTPPHFIWEAPNGSRVHAYRTPEDFGYGAFYHYATEPYTQGWDNSREHLMQRAVREIDRETESLNAPYLVLHDALDHQRITKIAPWLAQRLSEHYGCPVAFETLDHMAETVLSECADDLPVRRGELAETAHADAGTNILLTYVLSSRYDVKRQNDDTQNIWEKWAEPLTARAVMSGHDIRPGFQKEAYLELIRCHAHDSICGCSVQDVHRDMMYRFRQAQRIAEEVIDDCLRADVSALPQADGETRLLMRVMNPLPYARSETLRARICLNDKDCRWFSEGERPYESKPSFLIRDMCGQEIPYTLCDVRRARIEKTPTSYLTDYAEILLPVKAKAMGYTDYEIVPAPAQCRARYLPHEQQHGLLMENAYLCVRIQPCGGVTLTDKRSGKTHTDLMTFADNADIGDGWMHIRPAADYTSFSQGAPCELERLQSGPGGQACRVRLDMRVPVQAEEAPGYIARSERHVEMPITLTLSLGALDEYLSVEISVENTARDHRLRLCLPTDVDGDTYQASQAFAFVSRRAGAEDDTRDWKEPQTGERNFDGIVLKRGGDGNGLAVICGAGLHEAAVMNDSRHTMLITLLRAFEKTAGTNGEPDGQLQGTLQYALRVMPIGPAHTRGALVRLRDEMKAPLRQYEARVSAAHMPLKNESFVEVCGDVAVSAIKLPEDRKAGDLIVRVVNDSDASGDCTLRFRDTVVRAWRANLLEEKTAPCAHGLHDVPLTCAPWEIVTVRLEMMATQP